MFLKEQFSTPKLKKIRKKANPWIILLIRGSLLSYFKMKKEKRNTKERLENTG